jgi:oligopeptide/dipeptide ABC transporter ATP-binding protein
MSALHDSVAAPLLEVRNLTVAFRTEDGVVHAVNDVSFVLNAGEVACIVGESGCGKTMTVMAIMRLISDPNAQISGEVMYKGRNLMALGRPEMREVRGSEIAMIYQDPMTSLNPVYRVGWQIEEQLREHEELSKQQARARAVDLLKAVGIPEAASRVDNYPHEFSGGMRQRAMIAMALANNPALLIADEPTTALDVTIQAQILALLKHLMAEFSTAVLLITHNMGVVAELADRVHVMYAGRIVEEGTKLDLFDNPQHPYTMGLLRSMPRLDRPKPPRLAAIPGAPPSLIALPTGCSFAPRCAHAYDVCRRERPVLEDRAGGGHPDACHLSAAAKRRHWGDPTRVGSALGQ